MSENEWKVRRSSTSSRGRMPPLVQRQRDSFCVLRREVTMKMTKMRALVVGCSGVAVEIVKNLVLQGLGAVTLIDSKPAKIQAPLSFRDPSEIFSMTFSCFEVRKKSF